MKDSFRHGILPQPVFCLVSEVLLGQIQKEKTLLPELQQRSLSSGLDIVSVSRLIVFLMKNPRYTFF